MLPDSFFSDESSLYAPTCGSDASLARTADMIAVKLGLSWVDCPAPSLFRIDVAIPSNEQNCHGMRACWVEHGESIFAYAHRTRDAWSCSVLQLGSEYTCSRLMYDANGVVVSMHAVRNSEALWRDDETGTLIVEYTPSTARHAQPPPHQHQHQHQHQADEWSCADDSCSGESGDEACIASTRCACGCDGSLYCEEVFDV
jgi:hypothetical protein